ncbi:COG3650 family protein [Paracoccus chinensis]|uniref:SH3 domain-containing protein n=1 Tax=Paracoccus chinensis TaxID=525640 RepID=A0A1G9M3Q5_9RHOB|nr:SH3 domain-containing protein [Paracoccus chinensis]SDL68753.1 SH3 domain-containing protein [Paracoccus chinensis]
MRLVAVLALTLSLAGPAAAQTMLPTLYDVTGVKADDVLNIRAMPDASSSILSELPHDATGVEVIETRSGWARVNTFERSGWVNMRYLKERPDVWRKGEIPATLNCLGTEPFWTLRQVGNNIVYETPEQSRPLQRRVVVDNPARREPARSIVAGDDNGRLTVVLTPAQCTDGMSDRFFGLSATLLFEGAGQATRMENGCCRITP